MTTLARAALLLLATAGLGAADLAAGLQLGPAFPLGDMRTLTNGSLGGQLVVFGLWDLGLGHGLRARLDGTSASGKPRSIPSSLGPLVTDGLFNVDAGLGTLGADYLYFLEGSRQEGPYLGAGLAYGNATLKAEYLDEATGNKNAITTRASSPVYSLYAGCQFTARWSLELSIRDASFRKTFLDDQNRSVKLRFTLPVVALVAGYTF